MKLSLFVRYTKILSFKDRLYFFQKKAVGIASVNEKATTSVSDGSALVLGELGLLSRYDYYSRKDNSNKKVKKICIH